MQMSSFFNLDRESSLPLQLVHSDVWQSPVVSFSGCCYYVIFIDDYSRFSWLFPLKSKSDVYTFFIKFKCMVKNLFSTKIKSLQSNGGGEYSSTHFNFFFGLKWHFTSDFLPTHLSTKWCR